MATFRQELPPAGGFQRIEWNKQPSFKKVNGFRLLALALAVKAGGYYMYLRDCTKRSERELEQNDARIAISPFLLAESDRGYMKFLRSLREEEEVLMKDVPNWRPGMLYDEPIYYTRNPDDLRVAHRFEESVFTKGPYARGNFGLWYSGYSQKLNETMAKKL